MIGVNFGTLCHIFTLSRSPYRESLLRSSSLTVKHIEESAIMQLPIDVVQSLMLVSRLIMGFYWYLPQANWYVTDWA